MTIAHLLRTVPLGIVLLASMLDSLHAQPSRPCQPLKPESNEEQHVLVEQPGCYVLTQSFKQGWWFVLSEGGRKRSGNSEMILTTGTDIDIDLAGFSLTTNTGIGGISARAGRYSNSYPFKFVPMAPNEVHRIHIHNGTIDLTNSKEGYTGPGVIAPDDLNFSEWRMHSLIQPEPVPTSFRKVEYVLENLTIKTQGEAAMLKGDGIVIRNCTIEARADNALIIYGPNAVIENNRIVFRYKNSRPNQSESDWTPGHYPRLRSAIYLRGANSAIVRGNTIDISQQDRPVSAVAVVESKDVLIEGNRFNTDVTPVVLNGASTAILKRNEVKGGLFSKRRMLPDAVLR